MVSKDQAMHENMFHDSACRKWRRNGQTQLWKSAKNQHRFRVPVKFGLYSYDAVTELNAEYYHVEGDENANCKVKNVDVEEVVKDWAVHWYKNS